MIFKGSFQPCNPMLFTVPWALCLIGHTCTVSLPRIPPPCSKTSTLFTHVPWPCVGWMSSVIPETGMWPTQGQVHLYISCLPCPTLAPETAAGTGAWHMLDQSQNQEDPNSMTATTTHEERFPSAGVAMKTDSWMVIMPQVGKHLHEWIQHRT